MRYVALWIVGAVVIFIAAVYKTPVGPVFAVQLQPLLSLLISGLVLLLTFAVGLPIRLRRISHVWHGTLVGLLTAVLFIVVGWIALISFFTSTQRYSSLGGIILGLCGLFAVDFGIIHWPEPRKV
jgi:hypothetical protein